MCGAEEDRTELMEKGTLKGLGEKIGEHVGGGTMDNVDGVALGVVGDEKVTDIDMAGSLSGRGFTILFEFNGAFVVLVESCVGNGVSLGGHEHFDEQSVGKVVTRAD